MSVEALVPLVQRGAITGDSDIVSQFCEEAAHATCVLLGEATHGTQEFYETRLQITQMLIEKHGFTAVILEADMVDTISANDASVSLDDVMVQFKRRFPKWMWSNKVVRSLVEMIRKSTASLYGFDCYAVKESIDYVLKYLSGADPELYLEALSAYSTLMQHDSMDSYREQVSSGKTASCCAQITDMLFRVSEMATYTTEWFLAVQCARTIKTGELYYRGRVPGQTVAVDTWNVRDQHMSDTVQEVLMHQSIQGVARPRIIVWAHNSHLGDARATAATERGEWNVGQLLRESMGLDNVYNLGFLTFNGTVRASHEWGQPSQVMQMSDAINESWSGLFKHTAIPKFMLKLRSFTSGAVDEELLKAMSSARQQRAIGVLYKRESEAISHMFMAVLPYQFDSIVYIETTNALLL